MGLAPVAMDGLRRTMAHLVGPGSPPDGVVSDALIELPGWPAFEEAARDPFSPTEVRILRCGEAPREGPSGQRRAGPGSPVAAQAADAASLADGLTRGEIVLRYQPIVRLRDRQAIGAEALARWVRPAGSPPLSPDLFMPLVERTGLATAFARVVARRAADDLAAMRRAGGPAAGLNVSINLSLEVMLRADTASFLAALCRSLRLPPTCLRLELTETTPVRDLGALRSALLRLRAAGHAVVADDMALDDDREALLDLPFAGIKLDRHLINGMPHSRRCRAAVERLVARARARGMRVTAEGVSSPALWRAAARAGVDNAQGHAVGRPLPASALPAWISAWQGLPLTDLRTS
ncbi:EAL domain-containing protein [Muricoccus radiodurans]|uniref:EAL domain-containing protein n=1 Tax=Muricoccus radiodurans TaxID=2231721 RepID=UPI003CF44399